MYRVHFSYDPESSAHFTTGSMDVDTTLAFLIGAIEYGLHAAKVEKLVSVHAPALNEYHTRTTTSVPTQWVEVVF